MFLASVNFFILFTKNFYKVWLRTEYFYLFFIAELTSFFTLSHSGPQWQYFASVDLLVELTKCLLSSKVTSAVIIWRRHQVK